MLKKIIALIVIALCHMVTTLAQNNQYLYKRHEQQQTYALVPQDIKDFFDLLYTEKKINPQGALAGLYIALISGYEFVPFEAVLAACQELLNNATYYHNGDLQKRIHAYKNDLLSQTPVVSQELNRGSCKNKILDCLVVKGSACVDTLSVGGMLCGIRADNNVIGGTTGVTGATGFTGNQPTAQDARGAQGITGSTGPQGFTGQIGTDGLMGARGAAGETGINGITGAIGATGFTGNNGSIGAPGVNGVTGLTGATGFTGARGARGAQAVTGNTGATVITQAYGYLYKINPNIQEYGTFIAFSNIGTLFNISYTTFEDPVIFDQAGTYQITVIATAISTIFTTANNAAVQIGLLKNGVPIDGARFGAGATDEPPTTQRQVYGQIITTVEAGDEITVVNTSSASGQGFFTFFNLADRPRANTNLSMIIRRLD